MDRKNYFFRQKVTELELDSGFVDAENALWNNRLDDNAYGVITGLVASLAGAPTVTVTKGVAYDQLGRRVKAYSDGASSKTLSYANDTTGASTAVTAGQERWVSIYANWGRLATDPRVDGNAVTQYFQQNETLHDGTTGPGGAGVGGSGVDKFKIVMGTSAPAGTATRPALLTDAILVADILRTPSDASNAISATRRQVFGIADSTAPGTGNGLSVIMSAMSAWLGGRTNPAQASLHAAIDKIITDLAATTAADDGAERIGAAAAGTLSTGSVRSQLDNLDTLKAALLDLAALTGATLIGAAGVGNLTAGTVRTQLTELDTEKTAVADLAATPGATLVGAAAAGTLIAGTVRTQLNQLDTTTPKLTTSNTYTGGGNTQAIAGAVTVGTTLGVTGVTTLGDRARIAPTQNTAAIDAATQAADTRLKLFEFTFTRASQGDTKLRIYLNSKPLFTNGPQRSFLITHNASWDGANWNTDSGIAADDSNAAYAIEIGGSPITNANRGTIISLPPIVLYRREGSGSTTQFADAGWGQRFNLSTVWQNNASTFINGADSDVAPNAAGLFGHTGENKLNAFTGEYVIGITMMFRKYIIGKRGYAGAGITTGGVQHFGAAFTGAPSSITYTTGAMTNVSGSVSTATVSRQHVEWQASVSAIGEYRVTASVDVAL